MCVCVSVWGLFLLFGGLILKSVGGEVNVVHPCPKYKY